MYLLFFFFKSLSSCCIFHILCNLLDHRSFVCLLNKMALNNFLCIYLDVQRQRRKHVLISEVLIECMIKMLHFSHAYLLLFLSPEKNVVKLRYNIYRTDGWFSHSSLNHGIKRVFTSLCPHGWKHIVFEPVHFFYA